MRMILKTLALVIACGIYACNSNSDNNTEPLSTFPDLKENVTFTQITNDPNSFDFHTEFSNDGSKIAFARYNDNTSELFLLVYSISTQQIDTIVKGFYGDLVLSWSPDDTEIAFDARATEDAMSEIYIVDLQTKQIRNFTNTSANEFRPAWSKDGNTIVYYSNNYLYQKPILFGGSASLIPNTNNCMNPSWNSDDTKLLVCSNDPSYDILCIEPDGSNKENIANGNCQLEENWPEWATNDQKIIYQHKMGSQCNIVMRDLQSGEVLSLTNQNDCRFPDWNPQGGMIVYAYAGNLWLAEF